MTDIQQLRVVVAVADAGGFAQAARQLAISAPAVTRSIAGLERQLGVRLIERTTRKVRLTEAGLRFTDDARRILALIGQAETTARTAQALPEGEISITAPVSFGRLHVAPLLLDYLAAYPTMRVRALFTYQVLNLVADEIDVAVRIGHLSDSGLTAVHVGALRHLVVASPDYLARHGEPRTLNDLSTHRAVAMAYDVRMAQWLFPAPKGARTYQPPQPDIRLTVNSQEVAIEAALAGHGLIRALSYQVQDLLAQGRLQTVLTDYEPALVPVHLVYVGGGKAPARVKSFIEFAAARLRKSPALKQRGV
ncbi:LysR family transcriptional regulator [Achromobacter sp. NPDC008082]|jgi:DNA-binding transcriptional LysR family regulator|uniref:LysR family transcriptional regulator n=1 Tax=Achromobacter sp. NPDC008082 TaxID=3363888 RepID=UPI0036E474C4